MPTDCFLLSVIMFPDTKHDVSTVPYCIDVKDVKQSNRTSYQCQVQFGCLISDCRLDNCDEGQRDVDSYR